MKDGKAVAAIIGKMKSGPEMAPEEEAGEYDAGLETAAGELVSAVEAGDVAGVVTALKSFIDMCK